jgi:hypothetical protein
MLASIAGRHVHNISETAQIAFAVAPGLRPCPDFFCAFWPMVVNRRHLILELRHNERG